MKAVGQRAVIARGGIGGKGNARFKSSTFQTPRVAEKGGAGEERTVTLEVKLIADVGLGRLSERRQVNTARTNLCRKTEDCGLPLHNANPTT